jgi:glycosyltransferase involved in cell wall biosynthesis
MKRILYLSRGGDIGGSQRQLGYLLSNIDRNQYEPIVALRNDGEFFNQLRSSGISTRLFNLRSWRKFPEAFFRYIDAEFLLRWAEQQNVELIHTSNIWLNAYMIAVARRLKTPTVLHVRKPVTPAEIHKHNFDRANAIIAISRRIQENLLDAGVSSKKVIHINDAVDLEMFSPTEPKVNVLRKDFSAKGEILVGIVGRIDPFKNQLKFLKAFKQIKEHTRTSFTCFVVGPVHSQRYYERVKAFVNRNDMDRDVIFTGRRTDMHQVLCSLDILVSLSGGSIMYEAMACGKPVISAGFSTEEVSVHIRNGQTGLLVPSKKTSKLAEAMRKLIENPKTRHQIGAEARKWAEHNLSHVEMVTKTKRIYKQLLSHDTG